MMPRSVHSRPSPEIRGFHVADALILIGTAALGMGIWKHNLVYVRGLPRGGSGFPSIEVLVDLNDWVKFLSVLMVCLAWGMMILRVRQPRPRARRIGRQPGFIACVAVCLGSLADWIMALIANRDAGYLNDVDRILMGFVDSASPWAIGPVVIVAWVSLVLASAWRPERHWIDRLGRLQGGYWLVAAILVVWNGT